MQGDSEAASDKCIHVVNAIQYSNDPDKLLFRYRCAGPKGPNLWAVYEFSGGRAYDFDALQKATKNAIHDSPSYSRDGKLITFVAGQANHRNIFVMNADGSNVRQLTKDYNENPKEIGKDLVEMRINASPSFSPDSKKIIFKRSAAKRTKQLYYEDSMSPSRWDIYEIEITKSDERRLTNYAFNRISDPYFLSDGKRFIFSAYLHTMPSDLESGVDRKAREKYWIKYKQNTIFIMDGENNTLEPILINGHHSDEPQVTSDGVVVFRSDVTDVDGFARTGSIYYDLFVYKEGWSRRLLDWHWEGLHFTVSPDGRRTVYTYGIPDIPYVELHIINLDGTGKEEIRIPWRQLEKKK